MPVSAVHTSPEVIGALRQASASTGVDFDYLLATAQRESGLDPQAQAKSSSAAGLFQFVEQTWLATLKEHGAEHGYETAAAAISRRENGRYEIADPARKAEILALRHDPQAAASMAAAFTRDSAEVLQARFGKQADAHMLYAAHFLGVGGASALLDAAVTDPEANAATLMPRAAAANRTLFYDSNGAPRSVAGLLAALDIDMSAQTAPAPDMAFASSDVASAAPVAISAPEETDLPRLALPAAALSDGMRFAPAASYLGGFGQAAGILRLTPAIIEILASLDAPAGAEKEAIKA